MTHKPDPRAHMTITLLCDCVCVCTHYTLCVFYHWCTCVYAWMCVCVCVCKCMDVHVCACWHVSIFLIKFYLLLFSNTNLAGTGAENTQQIFVLLIHRILERKRLVSTGLDRDGTTESSPFTSWGSQRPEDPGVLHHKRGHRQAAGSALHSSNPPGNPSVFFVLFYIIIIIIFFYIRFKFSSSQRFCSIGWGGASKSSISSIR